jgi:hypothetical protein
MLYAIQQTISLTKFRAQLQAAHPETAAKEQAPGDALSRVQDYPGFEQEFGSNPGGDVDAETGWTLHKADEEAELRQPHDLPTPPLGLRPARPNTRFTASGPIRS